MSLSDLSPASPRRVTRGYVPSPHGQLHFRSCGSATGGAPTLACLHATAYSGRSFETFLPHMATDRRVLAPDTPGYGESDGPAQPLDIAGYAATLDEALDALLADVPLDLLGYHTGAFPGLKPPRGRCRPLTCSQTEQAEQPSRQRPKAPRMIISQTLAGRIRA